MASFGRRTENYVTDYKEMLQMVKQFNASTDLLAEKIPLLQGK